MIRDWLPRFMQSILIGAMVGAVVTLVVELAVQADGLWQVGLPRELSWHAWRWSPWVGLSLLTASLLAGQILRRLDQARPRGPADVIHATWLDRDPEFRQGMLSSLLALGNVAGGASVGLFGPSVHLGGWVGAWIRRRLQRSGMRVLLPRDLAMAAGLSAAVAALFLAPFAGVVFGVEIVLRRVRLFALMLLSVASAAAYGVACLLSDGFLLPGSGRFGISVTGVGAALGLGLAAGLVASAYIWAATHMPSLARLTRLAPVWRPLVPAAVLFAISPVLPHLLGPGFTSLPLALTGEFSIWLLVVLLIGKLLATPLCLGFGFAGGVVGPALFLGAMLGGLVSGLGGALLLGMAPGDAGLGLMAAAACVACVTGAPLASLLLLYELTGSSGFLLPGGVTVLVAVWLSRSLVGRSLFERQLALRGVSGRQACETTTVCDRITPGRNQ